VAREGIKTAASIVRAAPRYLYLSDNVVSRKIRR